MLRFAPTSREETQMSEQVAPVELPSQAGWGEERSRTVTWHDPGATALAGLRMPGIAYITAMAAGVLPPSPIGQLVGMTLVSAVEGDVVFGCVADESFYNPVGTVHGGLVCTLLDSATASAVHSMLPPGRAFTTIDLNVSYLRAVRAGDELRAHGWVSKPGSRVCFAEADVRTPDGKLVAKASSSLLVFDV
jgi:uncharacterized protein (TIGR00369 family)